MYSHKQSCTVFKFGRLVPCAMALLCLTACLAPATGKPYTSNEGGLSRYDDIMKRHEMINNGRLFAQSFTHHLRLQMDKMMQKAVKPMPSRQPGGVSYCLWKVCPANPWLVSKLQTKQF